MAYVNNVKKKLILAQLFQKNIDSLIFVFFPSPLAAGVVSYNFDKLRNVHLKNNQPATTPNGEVISETLTF